MKAKATPKAHQRGDEELDLVPVGMAGHAGVLEPDFQIRALAAAKAECFVRNRAEALNPLDRLDQGFRRSRDVVEQADPAQIELLRELEPEPVSFQGLRHRLHKGDLRFGLQALTGFFELRRRQARGLQERAKVDAGSARFLGRESG